MKFRNLEILEKCEGREKKNIGKRNVPKMTALNEYLISSEEFKYF